MPNINYAFKEITCKIVYYGPGAGGKTTNLQFVHGNVPQKHRGELVSLATEQDRTLFFDFLPLDIGDVKGFKTKFQLYTVPGQVFYNQTRKLVLRGVDGIVFVADSGANRFDANLDSLNNLIENLKDYDLTLDDVPFVIQYNKRDLPDAVEVDKLQQLINPEDKWKWFEGVATDGTGCRETLREVSSQILRKLNEKSNIVSDEEIVGERLGVNVVEPLAGTSAPTATGGSPDLDILQRSKFKWHNIAVGGGTITLSTSKNAHGQLEYQLKSSHKVLGSKRSLVRLMKYVGEDKRVIDGQERTFYLLRDASSKDQAPVSVFVEKISTPKLFLTYPGIGGDMKAGPEGESIPL